MITNKHYLTYPLMMSLAMTAGTAQAALTPEEDLGKSIFSDTDLSMGKPIAVRGRSYRTL